MNLVSLSSWPCQFNICHTVAHAVNATAQINLDLCERIQTTQINTSICVLNHKQLNYTLDIATSAGCILPPLIGAHRNPASRYLLFLLVPKKGHMKSSARTAAKHKREGIHTAVQHFKMPVLAVNKHQSSVILTTAYLDDWCPINSFLRTLGLSLNKRTWRKV